MVHSHSQHKSRKGSKKIAIIDHTFSVNLNDKDTVEYLKVDFPKVPIFYALPKVHKFMDDPPCCPIISGVGSLTEQISEYIYRILQSFVCSQLSYVKDTSHLLTLLHDITVPENMFLVTLEALYSS